MFSIILSGSAIILGVSYLKYQNNNTFFNTLFYTLYKLFYVFSFLQIKCIKIYGYLSDMLYILNPDKGEQQNKCYKYKNGKLLMADIETKSDLMIIQGNHLSLIVNTLIINDENDENNNDSCINIIESNVCFIAITMTYNGEKYKINLKDPEYNFYVVGNKIDKSFLQYYLVNLLFIPLEDINFEYTLEIIDNDVNFVFLNETQYILLEKDSYLLH